MPKKSKKSKRRRHQTNKSRKGQTRKRRPKASGILSSRFDDRDSLIGPGISFMNVSRDVPLVEGGYRIVGPAQAMVDYAKPLMEKAESEEHLNEALKVAQVLWNLGITKRREPEKFEEQKKDLVALSDMPEPEDMVDMMIERFDLMFPYAGIEPSFYMKERVIDVEEYEPFDESTLHISKDRIAPTEAEMKFAETLEEIDPVEDESKLAKWQDEALHCYVTWCVDKGVPNDKAGNFAFIVNSYLDFLSNYHGEVVSADTPAEAVEEFMRTFFIRKTSMPTQQKTMMPFALKLFMQYLDEKSIVSGTEHVRQIVESEQDVFQKNLRLFTNPLLEKKVIPFRRKS